MAMRLWPYAAETLSFHLDGTMRLQKVAGGSNVTVLGCRTVLKTESRIFGQMYNFYIGKSLKLCPKIV